MKSRVMFTLLLFAILTVSLGTTGSEVVTIYPAMIFEGIDDETAFTVYETMEWVEDQFLIQNVNGTYYASLDATISTHLQETVDEIQADIWVYQPSLGGDIGCRIYNPNSSFSGGNLTDYVYASSTGWTNISVSLEEPYSTTHFIVFCSLPYDTRAPSSKIRYVKITEMHYE